MAAVAAYCNSKVTDAVHKASRQGQSKAKSECMSVMSVLVKEAEEKAGLVLADVQTRVSGGRR